MLKFKTRSIQQNLVFLPFIILFFLNSCMTKSTDSELINKVNEAQQQMMKQGNISDEEKQAFLSLKKIVGHNSNFDKSIVNASKSELINMISDIQKQMAKQGNISEKEKQAIQSLVSLVVIDDGFHTSISTNAILFNEVDNAPIFSGCENLSKEEAKKCFEEEITKFINTEFNSDIAKDLGLLETKFVDAFFQIDQKGKVSNIKVRDADVTIQAEISRVLRKLPKMIPATQNGKYVPILYSVPVTYGNELIIQIPE